jgi:alpha/beta superfamily hydrolase
MKTTEQELDEFMKGRTDDDRAKVQDTEAAIRWLCRRLDEMKETHASRGYPFGGTETPADSDKVPRPNLTTEGALIPRAVWDALAKYPKGAP